MQQLSQSLAENLSALDARFGKSADYYAKKIVLYGCPGCIVMFDGMASLDSLWELLLDAAGRQSASVQLTGAQAYAYILHGSAFPAESAPVQDLPQALQQLRARGVVCLAAALYHSRPLDEAPQGYPDGLCAVIGSEGQGLTDAAVQACDMAVRIPMTDLVESLNAGVAGSVLLWHFRGV